MLLELAAEQMTEISREALDLALLPTNADEERGVQNTEFVLQLMHAALMALTTNDIVVTLRKNPLEAWRRLQKRFDLARGRKRHLFRSIISQEGAPNGHRCQRCKTWKNCLSCPT